MKSFNAKQSKRSLARLISNLRLGMVGKLNKKMMFWVGGGLVLVAVLVGVRAFVLQGSISRASDNNISTKTDVSKIFYFYGRNAEGYVTDQVLGVGFIDAERNEEVLIQGQRAQARNEKVFLLFDIAIRNESDQVLYLNLVDLVRWVEGETDLIAPQVTQGTLEVRPQSTKRTNLGFVIPTDQDSFKMQIGELNGEKTTFDVSF